jgi:hypothetical protein
MDNVRTDDRENHIHNCNVKHPIGMHSFADLPICKVREKDWIVSLIYQKTNT